jgi:hypothetical protein
MWATEQEFRPQYLENIVGMSLQVPQDIESQEAQMEEVANMVLWLMQHLWNVGHRHNLVY